MGFMCGHTCGSFAVHDTEIICDGVFGEREDLFGAPSVTSGPPVEKLYFSQRVGTSRSQSSKVEGGREDNWRMVEIEW